MTQINEKQFSDICVSLVLIRLFFTLPREMLICAGNAAWLLSLYITIIALFMFFIISRKRNYKIKNEEVPYEKS